MKNFLVESRKTAAELLKEESNYSVESRIDLNVSDRDGDSVPSGQTRIICGTMDDGRAAKKSWSLKSSGSTTFAEAKREAVFRY